MSEESYLRALARFNGDIRTGAIKFDYKTGACGPAPGAVPKSWGAACPPGYCTPDNLPTALSRWFAGDRAGCKELPYTMKTSLTSSTTLVLTATITGVSKVTMCPTRLMVVTDNGGGPTSGAGHNQWEITSITFGNQNQLVGGPVGADTWNPQFFSQLVPMVPDCLRAGQPYTINLNLKPEAMATLRTIYLVWIGPMVG